MDLLDFVLDPIIRYLQSQAIVVLDIEVLYDDTPPVTVLAVPADGILSFDLTGHVVCVQVIVSRGSDPGAADLLLDPLLCLKDSLLSTEEHCEHWYDTRHE